MKSILADVAYGDGDTIDLRVQNTSGGVALVAASASVEFAGA